ncbi:hypothetical protein ACLMJK_008652 [Lecanora helva]
MPGKSLESAAASIPTLNLGSLKGHKLLPRRNHVAAEVGHIRASEQPQKVRSGSDQITYNSAERIKSWIPEPSQNHVKSIFDSPLTPPINLRDDFQSWIDDAALSRREFVTINGHQSLEETHGNHKSPPTPEASPPKDKDKIRAVASSSSHNLVDSRSNSFKTAQENQASDDEGHVEDLPSQHPSRQKWLETAGFNKQKDVGLGLGLESEDEEPTPREVTPKRSSQSQHFATFDGTWINSMANAKTSEVLEDPVKPTSSKGSYKRPRLASESILDSPTLGSVIDTPLKKSMSLRERVERTRKNPWSASTEKSVSKIDWPLKDDLSELDFGVREINDKRLSEASTNSTVVEAVVIKSPVRRRQTLRRTSKMPDLTTPPPHSNRNSLVSNDTLQRRRLRRSMSPDQELRKSFVSTSPESIRLEKSKMRHDSTPVIPDRRSSLQTTASGSKRHSGTLSFISRQQSSRPTTAPEESVGYFDIPRPRDRRTMSVVVHAPTPVRPEHKALQEPASVAAEPSPPSVPTSTTEELSKSTSVTSAGIEASHASLTPNHEPSGSLNVSDMQNAQTLGTEQAGTSEWSAMRPRSTGVTPFSLRSAHSSTPGTLEIKEATAISIYPHTNKSILVIQQMPGEGDSSPKERSRIIAGNANINLPNPLTPVISQEPPPEPQRETVDSPLQNPREPPVPPDLKIIPPTPANASGSLEKRRSSPVRTKRFSAPVSSIKRAFSARRPRPESIIAPFSRTFSLRGTSGEPSRRTQADETQTKLHPFWRPRNYDEASDSDSEFGNTGFLHGSRVQSHSSSRDGPPRRTMSLTRRLTNSMRLPHPARKQQQRPSSLVLPSVLKQYEFYRPNESQHGEDKADKMPDFGRQVQLSGFRGLADKLERRREAKEEGKREERRQWLRGKIGPVRRESSGAGVVQGVGA